MTTSSRARYLSILANTLNSSGKITSNNLLLPDSGVVAGTYGSASQVPIITLDSKGRVTSASVTSVAGVSSFSYNISTARLTINTADGGTFNADITLAPFSTTNLTEGTNQYFTTARARSSISATGTNLSYNSTTGVLSYTQGNTDTVAEGATNLYYTNARARGALSYTSGSASYNSTSGQITIPSTTSHITEDGNLYYTDARVRAALAAGTGVTYDSSIGTFSIGQPVATTDNVTFANVTATGNLIVTGNLTVSGTTTTVNSTTVSVADINIEVARNATTAAQANGAGLTVTGPTTPATLTYSSGDDRWNLNKDLNINRVFGNVTGALTGNASTATTLQTTRSFTITGDAAWTVNFDGSANVSGALTLSNSGVTAGSYGSGTAIPVLTIDSKGRVTAATTSAVTIGDGTLTVSAGAGLTGSGTFTANQTTNNTITISHADTSSVANLSSDNAGNTFIQDLSLTFDTYGHVTGATVATGTVSVGDGAMTVTAGAGLTGGGQLGTANQTGASSVTVSHADTSSVANQSSATNTFISGITFDTYGHVQTITTGSPSGFLTSESDTLATVTARGSSHSSTITWNGSAGSRAIDYATNDGYASMRVIQNAQASGVNADGMYIGYQNGNSGITRIFGGGAGSGALEKYSTYSLEPGSFRSPIFYDSNDTAFYANPAGDSEFKFTRFSVSGYPIIALNNTNSGTYGLIEWTESGVHKMWMGMGGSAQSLGENAAYAQDGFSINHDGSGAFTISNRGASRWIRLSTGEEGTSNFHTLSMRNGDVIVNQNAITYSSMDNTPVVGSATTNRLHVNGSIQLTGNNDAIVFGRGTATFLKDEELGFGWGGGWYMTDSDWIRARNNKNVYTSSGIIRSDASVRAPIFYDQDNTAYYTDPTSGSRLAHLYVGNVDSSNTGSWNARLNVAGSSHARLDVISNSDGIITTMYSHTGQGVGRMGTMSNHPLVLMAQSGNDGGYVYNGSLRSPIFYDSNDTTYYGDFASTSRMNALSLNTIAITSGITGLTSAPITTQYVNAGTTNTWYPMTYQRAQHSGGYVTHLNTGLYKNVSGWGSGSSGWYAAIGGNDSYPTQSWYLTYDGYIQNSLGAIYTSSSFRAPIFYDIDNTAYFTDPAGRSRQSSIDFGDGGYYIHGGDWGMRNSTPYGWIQFGPANSSHAHIYTDRSNFYFNAQIQLNGGSQINTSDIRANIFYDNNDTGYYIDPNSTSNSALRMRGGALFGPNPTWGAYLYVGTDGRVGTNATVCVTNGNLHIDAQDGYDIYLANYNSRWPRTPGLYDNNDTGYYVDFNGTSRLNYVVPNRIKLVNNVNNEPRWDFSAYVVEAQHWYGNTSTQTMYLGESNVVYMPDIRPYIMYDRNDTGYYSDPASTSRLNFVNSNNHYIQPGYMLYSDHGSWQGEYNKIQWHSSHLYLQNAGGGYLLILRRGDGGERFWCDYNGNVVASGNITAYSDARLKTNVKTIQQPIELVKRLRGVTFDWISTGEHSYGLIAQEVEEVIPELVMESESGTADGDEHKVVKSVDYSKLVSVLIEAIKEQDDKINRLEALVETLINKLGEK